MIAPCIINVTLKNSEENSIRCQYSMYRVLVHYKYMSLANHLSDTSSNDLLEMTPGGYCLWSFFFFCCISPFYLLYLITIPQFYCIFLLSLLTSSDINLCIQHVYILFLIITQTVGKLYLDEIYKTSSKSISYFSLVFVKSYQFITKKRKIWNGSNYHLRYFFLKC